MELEDQLAALSLDANDFALSDRPSKASVDAHDGSAMFYDPPVT